MVYIKGGEFMGYHYVGCRDKTEPESLGWMFVPHRLYFAKKSPRWQGGGVAFLEKDPNPQYRVVVRLWKVSKEQFEDIKAQEGGWYNQELPLGEKEGLEIRTITGDWLDELNRTSPEYLYVIERGLRETTGWNRKEVRRYLEKWLSLYRQTDSSPNAPLPRFEMRTRKWFKENYGADPLKLKLPYVERINRYKQPYKLWPVVEVEPFRSEKGIELFKKRSEAGKKAFETMKRNLAKRYEEICNNPSFQEIIKQWEEINKRLDKILKNLVYDEEKGVWSIVNSCEKHEKLSGEENKLWYNLVLEKDCLERELEKISGMDISEIQKARGYYLKLKKRRENLQ
jgi:hypothetical protein